LSSTTGYQGERGTFDLSALSATLPSNPGSGWAREISHTSAFFASAVAQRHTALRSVIVQKCAVSCVLSAVPSLMYSTAGLGRNRLQQTGNRLHLRGAVLGRVRLRKLLHPHPRPQGFGPSASLSSLILNPSHMVRWKGYVVLKSPPSSPAT
jgi:hypothetical protein